MTVVSWQETNQRCLMAALDGVRAALLGDAGAPETGAPEGASAMRASAMPPALQNVCAAFGLSPFERDILLLCAGMELDAAFARLVREAGHAAPTFGLALAVLPEAHWSALLPAAPLRRWQLVDVGSGDTLVESALRIDERVLHYLAGMDHPDARLEGLVEPAGEAENGELLPSHRRVAERIAALWSAGGSDFFGLPALCLCGEERWGKHAVAAAACAALGLRLHVVRGGDLPASPAERAALVRLWEREAILSGGALLLDNEDAEGIDAGRAAAIAAFAEQVRGPLLLAAREPPRWNGARSLLRLDVDKPSAAEQRALWQTVLGPRAAGLNGDLEPLVAQFHLSARAIRLAGTEGLAEGDEALAARLWDACRAGARPRLDDLARRIEAAAAFDDLVLPEPQKQTLREIALHVRQRARVYERWGFGARGGRGLGISALFSGPSGTGKTMAAEVLAGALHLDLYRIDLSQVVSKYIGETEKNLRRVFDAAEEGGAILLFDEADALFGKRSEVKDSHDRYANIEVSYLLQRMESYRGLAILTTNLKSALDTAFLRRLRFHIAFPFPDAAQRAEIWRRIFPADAPTEGLDCEKLARLHVAGGNIRNIALHAAFLAADADEPIRMRHLLQAARGEYAKIEKPLGEAEIGGWV